MIECIFCKIEKKQESFKNEIKKRLEKLFDKRKENSTREINKFLAESFLEFKHICKQHKNVRRWQVRKILEEMEKEAKIIKYKLTGFPISWVWRKKRKINLKNVIEIIFYSAQNKTELPKELVIENCNVPLPIEEFYAKGMNLFETFKYLKDLENQKLIKVAPPFWEIKDRPSGMGEKAWFEIYGRNFFIKIIDERELKQLFKKSRFKFCQRITSYLLTFLGLFQYGLLHFGQTFGSTFACLGTHLCPQRSQT